MNGTKEIFASIQEKMETYIVSTSYMHYVEEIAKYLGIEPANTYSTRFPSMISNGREGAENVHRPYERFFTTAPHFVE